MRVFFYSWFVCISAYANVYFKTTIIKQHIKKILIVGVPLSQALLGLLITEPPSVCVPDVIGTLACGFQPKNINKITNRNQNQNQCLELIPDSILDPVHLLQLCFGHCSPLVRWECNRWHVTKVSYYQMWHGVGPGYGLGRWIIMMVCRSNQHSRTTTHGRLSSPTPRKLRPTRAWDKFRACLYHKRTNNSPAQYV